MIHQFTPDMIEGRERVRERPGLATVINVDGFGDPPNKIAKYRELHPDRSTGLGAGFKLFYNEDIDLMGPEQVLDLQPEARPDRLRVSLGAGAVEGATRNRWWVLIGACTGLFVLMLDSTVVTLALPAIGDDLGASVDGLQWVQNAYLLTLAATVVTAGRLGDIRGRRRLFVAGMATFAAGSLRRRGRGLASRCWSPAGCVQGIGGAALLSLSLALTSPPFPAPSRPGRSGSGPRSRRSRSRSARSSAAR